MKFNTGDRVFVMRAMGQLRTRGVLIILPTKNNTKCKINAKPHYDDLNTNNKWRLK